MKKILGLFTLGVLSGLSAFAQDTPKVDLFLGYSMLRANSAQDIPAFQMHGGAGTLAINFNQYLAVEFEFGGYHNGDVNNRQFDTTALTYVVGPRLSLGRSKAFDPYIHTLFGGTRLTGSVGVTPTTGTGTSATTNRLESSQNSFAMAVGGGLDMQLGKHVSARLMQLDYFLTRLEAPSTTNLSGPTSNRNQNNFRLSAGVVFNFGGE